MIIRTRIAAVDLALGVAVGGDEGGLRIGKLAGHEMPRMRAGHSGKEIEGHPRPVAAVRRRAGEGQHPVALVHEGEFSWGHVPVSSSLSATVCRDPSRRGEPGIE